MRLVELGAIDLGLMEEVREGFLSGEGGRCMELEIDGGFFRLRPHEGDLPVLEIIWVHIAAEEPLAHRAHLSYNIKGRGVLLARADFEPK